jgi:hypothetical protein
MNEQHHIFVEPTTNFITIVMEGTLRHEDYEYLNKAFDERIKDYKQTEVNVLIDALRLTGWELEAAWDDLKFGLTHNKEFHKIAFVGNKTWEKYATNISNWFMHGEIKYFIIINEAKQWLKH